MRGSRNLEIIELVQILGAEINLKIAAFFLQVQGMTALKYLFHLLEEEVPVYKILKYIYISRVYMAI